MRNVWKRTDMCGTLRQENVGKEVVLNGWVSKKRNLGGLIFCDLRDRTGITQIVFTDEVEKEVFEAADSLKSEYVIGVKGKVVERESKNKDIPTGDIEVIVDEHIEYVYVEPDRHSRRRELHTA